MINSKPTQSPLWLLSGVLILFYFIFRLPGLMAMPIFTDEAIYLVWVDRIREGYWWVSLADPKPPLHFWLIAMAQWVFEIFRPQVDPLLPARFLSVLAGAGSIVAMLLLVQAISDLAPRSGGDGSSRVVGLFAVLLLIFSPFMAFYQRLATADALFVLQLLLFLWTCIRWALSLQGTKSQTALWACAMGSVLGTAVLTRQNISYVLVAMLPLTIVLAWYKAPRESYLPLFERAAWSVLLALGITVVMFLPVLLTDAVETDLKSRIFYQSHFTEQSKSRVEVASANTANAFLPKFKNGVPEQGWLYFYLTGPVFIAALLSWPYLLVRRYWRVVIFLWAAAALMLGPVIVLGNVVFSRYFLAGAAILLLPIAFAVADIGLLLFTFGREQGKRQVIAWGALIVLLLALLWPGLSEISRQNHNPFGQTLTRGDRYQYLTGWSSGASSVQMIDAVKQLAERNPLVVITTDAWGHPADAVWAYLEKTPNVTVYYTAPGKGAILRPVDGKPDHFWLRRNKWRFTPAEPCEISRDARVLFVTRDELRGPGQWKVLEELKATNGELGAIPFYGIENEDVAQDRVLLIPLVVPQHAGANPPS